ncbi:hypothetical protein [Terrabacter carboxydivorans]|uniref:Uncharacterized protein n=1 Tax=Terrabacter carboxydivorans TaxID=619730 RepID=A0ABN3LIH3_9MICO
MGDTMRTEKKNSKKKKSAAFVAAGVIGLATAGGAYAYWTSLGGGAGTASTSAGASNVFAVTGNVANAMFPGDTAQTVTATVVNNGTENYKLQTVKAYVTTDKQNCDSTNFKLNGVEAPANATSAVAVAVAPADLAPSATTSGTFTMQFNNKTTNQDACKGAAVTITYVAS